MKNFGFVFLLAFLLLSITVDKLKDRFSRGKDSVSKRGEERDAVQVFANGAVPLVCAILYFITAAPVFIIGYCAALSEAFSDTVASGIGSFAKFAYDPFRMRKVEQGLSGGMSPIGTLASLFAPFLILLIAVAFGMLTWYGFVICALSAFFGALADSMIGSLLQAKFRCVVCGKITEKHIHCESKTVIIGGLKFFSNDLVNLISSAIAASIAIFVYSIL